MNAPFQPPYELIRDKLLAGKVIPFLGAGASMTMRPQGMEWFGPESGFLPTWSELANYLDRRSGFPPGELADLPRVAQYFHGVAGRGGLDEELHNIFARAYEPMPVHRYLAEFPTNLLIVTTNYDNLIERAFTEKGRPFDLVIYNINDPKLRVWQHDASQPEEVPPNECAFELGEVPVIYKMHGTVDHHDPERDSYVITEDDYVEFLARMVSATVIPANFGEPFKRRHFLFLGYGLRDWNLRVILHKIWKDFPRQRYGSWAINYRASSLEREFWTRNFLTIFELTIDEFVKKLGSCLLSRGDLKNSVRFLGRLRDTYDPLCQYLQSQFSPARQQELAQYDGSNALSESFQQALVEDLNTLLQGPSLFEPQRFTNIALTEETRKLIAQNPQGEDLVRLNRRLIEEAFSNEIAKSIGRWTGPQPAVPTRD